MAGPGLDGELRPCTVESCELFSPSLPPLPLGNFLFSAEDKEM